MNKKLIIFIMVFIMLFIFHNTMKKELFEIKQYYISMKKRAYEFASLKNEWQNSSIKYKIDKLKSYSNVKVEQHGNRVILTYYSISSDTLEKILHYVCNNPIVVDKCKISSINTNKFLLQMELVK